MLKRMFFFALLLLPLTILIPEMNPECMAKKNANDYTIVLVHGFAGWGRNEMNTNLGKVHYWGGIVTDLEARAAPRQGC